MQTSQRFFKPFLETPDTSVITKDHIIDLVMTAIKRYDEQCQKSPPNKAALKRKVELSNKIEALNRANDLLEQNNAFTNICEFYLQYRGSGRLLNQVGDVFIYIFNLQTQIHALDQLYKSKLNNLYKTNHIKNTHMHSLEISLTLNAWSTSKINLLEKKLMDQKKYSNYIVTIYENVKPHLGNNVTEIVAGYVR